MFDECLAQLLKEEQLRAGLGLLKQKDVVAVLPTGFRKSLIYSVVRGSETLYHYGNGMIAQNYRRIKQKTTYPTVI